MQVAQALAHAHSQGIVHRDVKPGNVVVTAQGVAKLLDFGIARIVHMPSSVTAAGALLGTPKYMAPEAIRGEAGDERADIYSFGSLAYELLTGRAPFEGENATALMLRALQEAPPRVQALVPDCPPRLAALVHACLEKDPAERPPSMGDVVVILSGMPKAWDPALLDEVETTAAESEGGRGRRIVSIEPGGEPTGPMVRPPGFGQRGHETPTPRGAVLPIAAHRSAGAVGAADTAGLSAGAASAFPPAAAWPAAGTGADTPPGGVDPYDPSGFLTPPAIAPLHTPQALQPSPHADLSGRTVGRFTLHERLTRGRSGDLYKAFDPVRSALVGVKVLPAKDTDAQQRLMRGGGIWLKLQHPNLLRVLEVHPALGDEPALVVSELVEGLPLDRFAEQRHLGIEEAVWIALQVCDALAHIHAHGVVHREVRPRNVLVSGRDLHATLLDPGLARDANPELDAFAKTGSFVNDLAYAAPEQAHGRVDTRTDVYAVTALLYELLTHARVPFPLPAGWKPEAAATATLPPALTAILERGLKADPRARYPSVLALHDALRAFAHVHDGTGERQPVVALHGFGTPAAWQRAFAAAGVRAGLDVRYDRWNFGHFWILRFLLPHSRRAKVRWFRRTYRHEFVEAARAPDSPRPSIVAHRIGTYILGQALIRDPELRFDKVLLTGSVLPRSFPWDRILERGQVQAVRHEYGRDGTWARVLGWFVPGTGTSGTEGFSATHPHLEQERLDFTSARPFDPAHVHERWVPFIAARAAQRPTSPMNVESPQGQAIPWATYGLYAVFALLCAAVIVLWH
jgi:serine/threonine-protein kinase